MLTGSPDLILGEFILFAVVLALLLYLFFVQYKTWPRRSSVRLVLGNALIFLFLCSVALLLGEVYYRFYYDTTQLTSITLASKRWFDRHWQNNSWGYRDTEDYASKRLPGKRRITFLGDSFTAGHGVLVEERFATLYRNRRPEQEVHVLAQGGMDTGDQVNLLRHLAEEEYDFDQVVLCYYMNDLTDLYPRSRPIFEEYWMESSLLVQNSYLINTLFWRLTLAHDPFTKDYYPTLIGHYQDETWEVQKRRLKYLRRLIASRGGHLAVVTFPFLERTWCDQAGVVHDQIGAFWKELGVPHLDLRETLEPYSTRDLIVNPYDAHPSPRAHALAADAIIPFLDEVLPRTGS